MAEKQAAAAPAQKVEKASNSKRTAILARRLAAVQNAGTMTPKIQRGLDRLAANLVKGNK